MNGPPYATSCKSLLVLFVSLERVLSFCLLLADLISQLLTQPILSSRGNVRTSGVTRIYFQNKSNQVTLECFKQLLVSAFTWWIISRVRLLGLDVPHADSDDEKIVRWVNSCWPSEGVSMRFHKFVNALPSLWSCKYVVNYMPFL